MYRKCDDLEAPWVGKSREEYYDFDDEENKEDYGYDEDFAYESFRDMQLEDKM